MILLFPWWDILVFLEGSLISVNLQLPGHHQAHAVVEILATQDSTPNVVRCPTTNSYVEWERIVPAPRSMKRQCVPRKSHDSCHLEPLKEADWLFNKTCVFLNIKHLDVWKNNEHVYAFVVHGDVSFHPTSENHSTICWSNHSTICWSMAPAAFPNLQHQNAPETIPLADRTPCWPWRFPCHSLTFQGGNAQEQASTSKSHNTCMICCKVVVRKGQGEREYGYTRYTCLYPAIVEISGMTICHQEWQQPTSSQRVKGQGWEGWL